MDPLHITEFASERYFTKLRQLNEANDNAAAAAAAAASSSSTTTTDPTTTATTTFTLPVREPRHRDPKLDLIPVRTSDQKKRSLGHDLTSLRTQRRPSFSGSFGSLRSRVAVVHKTPTIVEHYEHIRAEQYDQPPM
jgi:hypothetical protein